MGFNIETGQFTITRKAAADLRTHQYKFVKLDANADVVLCAASGEGAIGVLQNKPNVGEAAQICYCGVTQVIAGAAVASNAIGIKTDATARAIAATRLVQASGNGGRALGLPLTDAGAAGDQFSMFIFPLGAVIPTADV